MRASRRPDRRGLVALACARLLWAAALLVAPRRVVKLLTSAGEPLAGGAAAPPRPGRRLHGRPLRLGPLTTGPLGSGRAGVEEADVARLLGARHAVEALAELGVGTRTLLAGAAVDALHAASMVALAAFDRRRRAPAAADAVVESGFVAAGLLLAASARRRHERPRNATAPRVRR